MDLPDDPIETCFMLENVLYRKYPKHFHSISLLLTYQDQSKCRFWASDALERMPAR